MGMWEDMKSAKNIYIMGYGRSGSTLFESLLLSYEKLNAFGEVKYLAERGALKNEKCSCGKYAQECEFWRDIIKALSHYDFTEVEKVTNKFESSKMFFINMCLVKIGFFKKDLELYKSFNKELKKMLISHGNYIDSSKMPARVYFLDYQEKECFYEKVYWMTRDPRGVAWSCMKVVERPEAAFDKDKFMPKFGFYSSILKWFFNSIVSNYIYINHNNVSIISYEDTAVNFEGKNLTSDRGELFNHSISGNPRRFNGGLREIKVDEDWRENLSRFQICVGGGVKNIFFKGGKDVSTY